MSYSHLLVTFSDGWKVNKKETLPRVAEFTQGDAKRMYRILAQHVENGSLTYTRHNGCREKGDIIGAYYTYTSSGTRVPDIDVTQGYMYLFKSDSDPVWRSQYVSDPNARTQHQSLLAHCHAAAKDWRNSDRSQSQGESQGESQGDSDTGSDESQSQGDDYTQSQDDESQNDSDESQGDGRIPVPNSECPFNRYDEYLKVMRAFCEARQVEGNFQQSARADFNGYKLIKAGVPVESIVTSIATVWSDDTREQFRQAHPEINVSYNPQTFGERIDGLHRVTPLLLAYMKADIPVWLHGATGTLKSSGLKYACKQMGIPYYETNLAGQMSSAITGRDLLKRFSESVYCRAYATGGVWAGEEFDKAHALILTQINNSIESDEYWNPMLEEPIKRHPDFRIIVSANTVGNGPTPEFPASSKVDGSTQDRFRTGYIKVERDPVVVRHILDTIKG